MPHLATLLAGSPPALQAGNAGPDLTRYLLVCGGLVLLVALLGLGLRRLVGRAWGNRAAQRSLQVLDVLPLGGKQRLVVVRCYDRTFALGVGDKEVSLVSELDAVIAPAREHLPGPAERRGFAEALARLQRAPAAPERLAPEGVLG